MAELPPDSGVDLTTSSPLTPQQRSASFYELTPSRARLRFWHRADDSPFVNVLAEYNVPINFLDPADVGGTAGGAYLTSDATAAAGDASVRYVTFACEFMQYSRPSGSVIIFTPSPVVEGLRVAISSTGNLQFTFSDAGALNGWTAFQTIAAVSVGVRYQLLAAIDVVSGTGRFWLNGVEVFPTLGAVNGGTLDLSTTDFLRIGRNLTALATSQYRGEIGYVYVDFGAYITDIDAFWDAARGRPRYLGTDGKATGLTNDPDFYFGGRKTPASWATNQGVKAGTWTWTNPTLVQQHPPVVLRPITYLAHPAAYPSGLPTDVSSYCLVAKFRLARIKESDLTSSENQRHVIFHSNETEDATSGAYIRLSVRAPDASGGGSPTGDINTVFAPPGGSQPVPNTAIMPGPTLADPIEADKDYTVHITWTSAPATSPGGNLRAYVNGVLAWDTYGGTAANGEGGVVSGLFPDTIDWGIGSRYDDPDQIDARQFEGALSFVWMHAASDSSAYLTNPQLFYRGGDADLGADGSTPLGGTPPLIYTRGTAAAVWNAANNNLGSLEDFTDLVGSFEDVVS